MEFGIGKYGDKDETISYIGECRKFVQKLKTTG